MLTLLERLVREENGQGMVEYALIIGLVAIAVIAAITAMTGSLSDFFTAVKTKIQGNTPQ
ncbi:MAG: Flp/Fap pilin component [Thermosediminibacterales bacterium]|nr:Flp/Fap pilin component [Thermosediminibacterales bacterium]